MSPQDSNSCTQIVIYDKKINAKKVKDDVTYQQESTVKSNESVKKHKGSQVRISKVKGKYTLRTKSQKNRIANFTVTKHNQEVLPYIPPKVFRVLTIFRDERLLKLIARFFKPTTKKTTAYNFYNGSNKIFD